LVTSRRHFLAFSGLSLALLSSVSRAAETVGAHDPLPRSIAGVKIPDSSLAKKAAELAAGGAHQEIYRHALRSFVFAALIAERKKTKYDAEVAFVSAILHDSGLSPSHATPHVRFEVDSANTARQLMTEAGMPLDKINTAWDAIVLHSMFDIAKFKQPEVMLVSAGVITDVGAAFVPLLHATAVSDLLSSVPRTNFVSTFLEVLADHARRKPDTVAGTFVEDVAERTLPGYTRANFYDQMKSGDPFDKPHSSRG
jgi:hypothetical protein